MEYFADNHPNIWFREQLEKNETLTLETHGGWLDLERNHTKAEEAENSSDLVEEESKTFNIVVEKEENDSSDSGITLTIDKSENQESFINGLKLELEKQNSTEKEYLTTPPKMTSKFFEDPLNPKPEEWLDWPPEKWIEWSQSEEYHQLYVDPRNNYEWSGVKQPEKVPVLDYREKQPILITPWSTPQPNVKTATQPTKVETAAPVVTKGERRPPPETNLPLATVSPTRDPNYVYREGFVQRSPHQVVQGKSAIKDIQPLHIPVLTEKRNRDRGVITSDYVYNGGVESSQLPSSENAPLSNLPFERYKDRETGAINPSLLLLTKKPFEYKKDVLPAAEGYNPLIQYPGQFQPPPPEKQVESFQEGTSPFQFSDDRDRVQGTLPAEGNLHAPISQPGRPARPSGIFQRPPLFRPERPGQQGARRPDYQTEFQNPASNQPNLPEPPASPDIFLPPIDPNNPNFQSVYPNPNPGIPQNPYYPPNYPYQFPNQFPPQQQQGGSSASTSTSTNGGSSGASAAASGGSSSSSSTSVSNGGNSNNDNKYYECTGPNCDRVQIPAQPVRDREEDRNVFFQDPTTSSSTAPTTTAAPNLLENMTLPTGNQAINLNIPPGVAPPTDLQEAIERGGNINVNCDSVNGCTTIIPPEERSAAPTTTRRPFRISIGPLFGNRRRPPTESPIGTDSFASDVVEVDELPEPGLGDDIVDEVFNYPEPAEVDPVSAFPPRPNRLSGSSNNNPRVSSFNQRPNRVSTGSNNNQRVSSLPIDESLPQSFVDQPSVAIHSNNRVGNVPVDGLSDGGVSNNEELRKIVKALSGLIQILNTTNSKGRNRLPSPVTQPLPIVKGHLGNKPYPVKNIIFDDAATFSEIKTHDLPDGETIYFNIKPPLPSMKGVNINQNLSPPSPAPLLATSTIPPHLIPLGPDGAPLVRPDGSFIDPTTNGLAASDNHLGHRFPFLSKEQVEIKSPIFQAYNFTPPGPVDLSLPDRDLYPTSQTEPDVGFLWELFGTGVPRKKKKKDRFGDNDDLKAFDEVEEEEEDHRDMFTRAIETMREMPMETRRHMLASMMITVPMAAVTMAAAGLPHLAIAPLATVIPGFMFAAFTDVNPHDDPGGGHHHGHGHHNDRHRHHEVDNQNGFGDLSVNHTVGGLGDMSVNTSPLVSRQQGIAGILQTIRNFNQHRRQNQTLHIQTNRNPPA